MFTELDVCLQDKEGLVVSAVSEKRKASEDIELNKELKKVTQLFLFQDTRSKSVNKPKRFLQEIFTEKILKTRYAFRIKGFL